MILNEKLQRIINTYVGVDDTIGIRKIKLAILEEIEKVVIRKINGEYTSIHLGDIKKLLEDK